MEVSNLQNRLRVRSAFKTVAIAFVIGIGMFFTLSAGWARVEDVARALKHRTMTPAEVDYEQRGAEERRVFDAFWDRERKSPQHSGDFWGFAATDPLGTTLTVRVPEAKGTE